MNKMFAPKSGEDVELNLFCSPAGEAYRVHTRATWLPGFLRRCFDENYEAYPVYLDLEDLDEEMASSDVTYEKRVTRVGGIEITAKGVSAMVLATWLAQSFASNFRDQSRMGGLGSSNDQTG